MGLAAGLAKGITACTGVEVQLCPDGIFDVRMLKITLQGKLVQLADKSSFSGGTDKLRSAKVKGPLAVILTGRGVLIRKTTQLDKLTAQHLGHLFPNFRFEEFYVQHFRSGAHSFIALVRKDIADPVLKELSKNGTPVLMLSLGPFAVDQVIPQLNNYSGSLIFDGHQVVLDEEGAWQDYSYAAGAAAGFELKLDIEPIDGRYLLAYAAAFQLLLHDRTEPVEVVSAVFKHELLELVSRMKFERLGKMILFSFLSLLLLSFLLLSYYDADNRRLESRAGMQTSLFADRQQMETEIKEKEELVNKLGWNKGLKYAYICDQIGQSVPSAVTLYDLQVNGLSGQEQPGKEKELMKTGQLKIGGQTASVYVLNDWIYSLKQKPWIKTVQLEKYAADEQKGTDVFTLMLSF